MATARPMLATAPNSAKPPAMLRTPSAPEIELVASANAAMAVPAARPNLRTNEIIALAVGLSPFRAAPLYSFKRPGFSSPVLSVVDVVYKSH